MSPEQEAAKHPTKGGIQSFFSNPLVGFLGSIASLIGLALAVYFYFAAEKKPLLTYQVRSNRTSIVNTNENGGFKISYGDKEIQGDVSAATVSLWNAGNQSIKTENILQPITISLKGVKILEAKIQNQTREVCGGALEQSKLDQGELGVTWKIFEENDGANIQLIYNSNTDFKIGVNGTIENQSKLNRLDSSTTKLGLTYILTIVLGVIPLGTGSSLFLELILAKLKYRKDPNPINARKWQQAKRYIYLAPASAAIGLCMIYFPTVSKILGSPEIPQSLDSPK